MKSNPSSLLLSVATVVMMLGPVASFAADGAAPKPVAPAEAKPAKDKDKDPVIKEGAELVLQGQLQGGMVGIGGETTGWQLKYATSSGAGSIDVDCSALDAAKIPQGAVRITGKVYKKDYVERGPTLILKAEKIEKAS